MTQAVRAGSASRTKRRAIRRQCASLGGALVTAGDRSYTGTLGRHLSATTSSYALGRAKGCEPFRSKRSLRDIRLFRAVGIFVGQASALVDARREDAAACSAAFELSPRWMLPPRGARRSTTIADTGQSGGSARRESPYTMCQVVSLVRQTHRAPDWRTR